MMKRVPVLLAALLLSTALGQLNPVLEFATGDGNPTGNGPVTSTAIRFRNNTDNPSGTTFATYAPALTATFTFVNQQFNFAGIAPDASVVMGYANAASAIFPALNAFGAPIDAYFTSAGSPAGTGISVTANRSVEVQIISTPLRIAGVSTSARVHVADLVIAFDRPVDDPVLHVAGLGGAVGSQRFSAEFDLVASNVPVTFSRLSGTVALSVNATQINHGQANPGATGADAASGSVLVSGTGITSVTLRTYLRGNGGGSWSNNTTNPAGDAFQMSLSTAEADLSVLKSVDVAVPFVGEGVVFTVTVANAGPSNASGVRVIDALPSGYTFVGATATAGTSYDAGLGAWIIDALPVGASRTLSITANVNPSGDYLNVATISGDQHDPVAVDDTASAGVDPRPVADLALTKGVSMAGPEVGESLVYTLGVVNAGPSDATDVVVTDVLPAGVLFLAASVGCSEAGGVVTCDLPSLPRGASASFDVEVEVLAQPPGTALVNDADALADEVDPDPTDNAASATATVSALLLEKSVCNLSASACADPADFTSSASGVPGDVLAYRVTFERFGPPVFDLELADDVPQAAVFVVDAYGPGQDVRVTCPDASTVFVTAGATTRVAFDLAGVCALDTATRADGVTVSEALLPGQVGEFRFRVAIP